MTPEQFEAELRNIETYSRAFASRVRELMRERDAYRDSLRMIAQHGCGGIPNDKRTTHCGECAWCVAADALKEAT
jgi:hypothetical protein